MDTQITIVGAGPVGLLSSINLIKNGISIRIFDDKKVRSELSRALVVHIGTLELLEVTHPELLKRFLEKGRKLKGMKFADKYEVNLALTPSKYKAALVLEQQESEEILEEYLNEIGVKVERNCRVSTAQDQGDKVVTIVEKDGEKFEVASDYLLDCSGAHSVIRKNVLRASFRGEKYFGKIVMGDVTLRSHSADDFGHVFRSKKGIAALVPINHPGFFRVILIPFFDAKIPQKITMEYFQNLSKEISQQFEIGSEQRWLTSFEISRRMTSKLNFGRMFLAGDAAHVHSPVGGQGMNLGLQDSFNICEKLKKVLKEGADMKIFDDYTKERIPVIKKVLRMTNAAMRSGVEKSYFSEILLFFVQKIIAPIFFRSKALQRRFCITLSQINSARDEIKRLK